MRNKETCVRLLEKMEGKLQTLLFILSRPNANSKEFTDIINDSKDIIEDLKRYIDREQETM
jgi:hypothetical protein|tara:strand:+ start:519 stop:701 length:183 start_codon:yes stop_codon:yes gene_type:complete